jgi:O-antigen ligase
VIAIWSSFRQSDWFPHANLRSAAGLGLAAVGFVLLCLFHGAASDLALFAYGVFVLLSALVVIGSSRIAAAMMATPGAFIFVLAWLAALALSYTYSLSKDGSFVPSVVLTVPMVGFVLGRALVEHAKALFVLVSLIVLSFACWSAASLIVNGELARPGVTDPNNYATLLYLILIAWIHVYLDGRWRGSRLDPASHALIVAAIFILFFTLFGTSSGVASVIIVVALLSWCGLALWRRLSILPVLLCVSLGVAAYLASALFIDVPAAAEFSGDSMDSELNARFALIGSAVAMLDSNLFTGIGIFVFPLLYRTYRTPDDLGTAGLFVHNDYLQFLVEGGLPLFGLAALFLIVVVKRCITCFFVDKVGSPGFSRFGLHLAICAAAFHALANFVYYTPVLGFVIGLMVALSSDPRTTPRAEMPGLGSAASLRLGFAAVLTSLVFGWACLWYLAVDAMSVGVFGGQSGVPLASKYRDDPDRMLEFAVTAQAINGNRGLPVLVEASLLERKLEGKPGTAGTTDALVARSLAAFQRAVEVDPWNGSTWLGLARFLDARPELRERAGTGRSPEELILASLEIDPLFVPGIDWLVVRYSETDRASKAYDLVRSNVLPWLRLLATENPEAAVNYFRYLESMAQQYRDEEVLAALEQLRNG